MDDSTEELLRQLPKRMREARRFMVRGDEHGKIPCSHSTGYKADATNEANWTTLEDAIEACKRMKLEGVSFVLGDGWRGIDLDHTDIRSPVAKEARKLGGYHEMSMSGKGLHYIAWTPELEQVSHKKNHVEFYSGFKPFALTGDRLDNNGDNIDGDVEADRAFIHKHFPPKQTAGKRTDEEVLSAAEEFLEKRPNSGDASADDYALACALACLTHDAAQVERIMRQTRLTREKWERADYLPNTISKAIDAMPLRKTAKRAVVLRASDVVPETLTWLAKPLIALRKLTVLAAPPGLGKTFLTVDIASRVTTGSPLADGTPVVRGRVLFINFEDDVADTLIHRVKAAGADLDAIGFVRGVELADGEAAWGLAHVDVLDELLQDDPDVRLVIIDPLSSSMGRVDAHRETEVRAALVPLVKLAQDRGVAVLAVMHLRKARSGNADTNVLGAVAFTGVARQVWHLNRDPEQRGRVLMLPGKSNISGTPTGRAFTIAGEDVHAKVIWERDPVELTADDAAEADMEPKRGRPADARTSAREWLIGQLASGPRPAKEVEDAATAVGIATGTLRRAREQICEKPTREGFGTGQWMWTLKPEHREQF